MSEQPIRVGIVGAGLNTTTQHIPRLQAIDGVQILSVCNRRRASAETVAGKFNIPQVFDRWEELVAAPETNAIVIGTWPNLHCPVTLAALAAGKHVLCEARMAMNAAEAHAMLAAARAKPHLVAQLVPAPFTLRVDNTVRRLLRERWLGEVLVIDVRSGSGFVDRDAPLHWRQDVALSGCNVLSLGIWYETILRWVGEAAAVMALGKVFVPTRRDATGAMREVHVPDHLDVIAELAQGGQACLRMSAVTGQAPPLDIWLFGSDGTLRYHSDKLFGAKRGDAHLAEIEVPSAEQGRWRVEEEFVNAIRGLEPVRLTTFEDGVRYMEFTEAAARSRQSGRLVRLPLDPVCLKPS
jgi:predicted dehydrogenase